MYMCDCHIVYRHSEIAPHTVILGVGPLLLHPRRNWWDNKMLHYVHYLQLITGRP